MDFKKFVDFGREVFNHNYEQQKKLAAEGKILLRGKLNEYIEKYPNAGIFLHYPNDEVAEKLEFCYTVSGEGPDQLLPVLSVYADENKIVLSYLPSLEGIDFSEKLELWEDYINGAELKKRIEKWNNHFDHDYQMIFFEHIPDSMKWKSQSEQHKMHQAFAFIGAHNYMLWSAMFFTPHY